MDVETTRELYKAAVLADLDGVEFLSDFSDDTLANSYNGIGPEFLPAKVRAKVTKYLAVFAPAALIHDLRNEFADGTRRSFNYANYEFYINCRKCAALRYSWWDCRRYRAYAVAKVLFKFVSAEQFGWRAWLEAQKRHAEKTSGNSAGENKEKQK